MWTAIFLTVTCSYLSQADLSAPTYIKYCVRNDPKFNVCALQRARDAFPFIVEGDQKYNVPRLDPYHINELILAEPGPKQNGLSLKLENAEVLGIKDATVDSINFDFNKQQTHMEFTGHVLQILGKYEISGNLLILPVNGKGDINITIVNPKVILDHDFTLESRGGDRFMKLENPKCQVIPSRMYMYPEHFFKGNNQIGKQMVVFLNENWRDIFREVSPAVRKIFSDVFTSVFNAYQSSIPFDVYFPEKLA